MFIYTHTYNLHYLCAGKALKPFQIKNFLSFSHIKNSLAQINLFSHFHNNLFIHSVIHFSFAHFLSWASPTWSGCVCFCSDFRFMDERKNRTSSVAKRALYYSTSDEKTWWRTFLLHKWLCSRNKAPKTMRNVTAQWYVCWGGVQCQQLLQMCIVSSVALINIESVDHWLILTNCYKIFRVISFH